MTKYIRIIFLLILAVPSTWAHEFQHFTLNKSASLQQFSLIDELKAYFEAEYNDIGNEQTRRLIENHDLGGGVKNFSGFTWYKPMVNYDISADRDVTPDLMSDRWIVQDTFTVSIEAATLLKNLADSGLIVITPVQLEAFAGLSFQRKYQYFHFADTYIDGLTSHYEKLFLSFLYYHPDRFFNLNQEEIIKKKDLFTFNAGGKVEAPLGNGLELKAGVLVSYAFKSTVMLHKASEKELKLNIEKEYNKSAEAALSLQIDFFELLKVTLLSTELKYSYARSKKSYLSLNSSDLPTITSNESARNEIKNILKGKHHISFWKTKLVSFEDRIKESFNSKYNFLLFGSLKKQATEQIVIVKNGLKKTFYKHYSQSKSFLQGLLSRIFSTVIQKVFKFDWAIKDKAFKQQDLFVEYEKLENYKKLNVSDEYKFSIKLSKSYFVDKTHKWYHYRFYRYILKRIKRWSINTDEIADKIHKKELIGPILLSTEIDLNYENFIYFNSLDKKNLDLAHFRVCNVSSEQRDEINRNPRRMRWNKEREVRCYFRLEKSRKRYFEKLTQDLIPLDILKNYLKSYVNKAQSLEDLNYLFGKNNLFIHGSLKAKSRHTNQAFTSFFKSGQFKGVGVIDQFKNSNINIPIYTNE